MPTPSPVTPRSHNSGRLVGFRQDDFHSLLQQVSEEHVRQLAELRRQNAALQRTSETMLRDIGHPYKVKLPIASLNGDRIIEPKAGESPGFIVDDVEADLGHLEDPKASCPRPSLNVCTGGRAQREWSRGRPKAEECFWINGYDHVIDGLVSGSCKSPSSGSGNARQISWTSRKSSPSEPSMETKSVRPPTPTWHFELLDYWSEMSSATVERKLSLSSSRTKAMTLSFEIRANSQSELVGSKSCAGRMVILNPTSYRRLCWDLLSMLLLGYDVLVIPFTIAFEPEDSFFQLFMTWFTLLWWTLDIVLTFCTGYTTGKQVVMKPVAIAVRYIKFWFWLDISIVGIDWVMIAQEGVRNGNSMARLGRTLRWVRFVRALRLMRIVKLKRILQEIQDQISTEAVSIWFGILKVVILLLLTNHIVACLWFMVGLIDDKDGWVETKMLGRDLPYQYATSLHWSLAQFTPAPNEIFPQTAYERCFALVVLVTALVAFSAFVSTVTAGVVQLRHMQSEQSRQFWLLRRYLRDWSIRAEFRLRVIRYLEYAYSNQRKRVQEKDVALLQLLSEPMREELRHETLHIHLIHHPLFARCHDNMRTFSKALESKNLATGDPVFHCGEQASGMVFLSIGTLKYFLGEVDDGAEDTSRPEGVVHGNGEATTTSHNSLTSSDVGDEDPDYVWMSQWVAEVALWCPWVHLGDLHAVSECQIIFVDTHIFAQSIRTKKWIWSSMKRYAANFLRRLNQLRSEDLTDLTHRHFGPRDLLDDSINFGQWQQEEQTATHSQSFLQGIRRIFLGSPHPPQTPSLASSPSTCGRTPTKDSNRSKL